MDSPAEPRERIPKVQDAFVVSVVAVPEKVIDASPALITGAWSIDTCSRGKEALASAADKPVLQQTKDVDEVG